MAIFHKTKTKTEDVKAELDAPVTFSIVEMDEVKATLLTSQNELAELGNTYNSLVDAHDSLETQVATLNASAIESKEVSDKLVIELKASQAATVKAEASAESKAIEILAKVGHVPVKAQDESASEGSVTRADFSAMSASQKSEFSKSGGLVK